MKLFTLRIPIPERFWKDTGQSGSAGNEGKIYKGKYEILVELPGLAQILGGDFKELPFHDLKLPMEKLVILESAMQVDNFIFATIDVRENPIPLIALAVGVLGVLGLGALGWSVTKITRLVEVTTKSVGFLAAGSFVIFLLAKKLRLIK